MEYLNRDELIRLFKVARQHNPLHHVALLVGLLHGLRVSETLAIRGRDICDGRVSVKRLKKSRPTLHALRIDSDPLFDESPLLELAKASPETELFPWSRQYTVDGLSPPASIRRRDLRKLSFTPDFGLRGGLVRLRFRRSGPASLQALGCRRLES